jgi:hypothetical protein
VPIPEVTALPQGQADLNCCTTASERIRLHGVQQQPAVTPQGHSLTFWRTERPEPVSTSHLRDNRTVQPVIFRDPLASITTLQRPRSVFRPTRYNRYQQLVFVCRVRKRRTLPQLERRLKGSP